MKKFWHILRIICVALPCFFWRSLIFAEGGADVSSNIGHGYVPTDGMVATGQTAINVAEAILIPIYGREAIEKQKPFSVRLDGGVWIVSGYSPSDQLGGSFQIKISKADGRIVSLIHGK